MTLDAPISAARAKIARWVEKFRLLSELNSLDAATRSQLAHELSVSEAELETMANLSMNAEGLERVLDLIGVDRAQLEKDEPALMADLRRSCTMCRDWKECKHDLDVGAFSKDIEHYCVNSDILRQLRPTPN
ncbi:MAG: hypothetical protein KDJ20_18315 [Hyphomicrobiales bacterium]|nr:hypothetical protein [Hyphomicrobiales bacterium]